MVRIKKEFLCLIIAALHVTSCVSTSKPRRGVGLYSEARIQDYRIIYCETSRIPVELSQIDLISIERIIKHIEGLESPIRIDEVHLAWSMVPNAVLIKIEDYNIYVVRNSYGTWMFSAITTCTLTDRDLP